MISFIIALITLLLGYRIYGRYVERIFSPDEQKITPAISKSDGIDYVPLKNWKIFMIQFLNIAGLGPIFGAIMGAKFGVSSYLWIVLGCIFAGATHDFFSGMLSLRNGGLSYTEIIGKYLGKPTKRIVLFITLCLLLLVGAVFVSGPAGLLATMTTGRISFEGWIAIIFAYYIIATLLPINQVIGRIYPLFALSLIFMALGVLVMLLWYHPPLPELWDGLHNTHPQSENMPIFPVMFITISCGAISGFHATQSPMMARCMKNEKYGRPIFYGAMISEGIIALIWAAAATYFFHEKGFEESNATVIAKYITQHWLGILGGALAIFGIIAAPISTGDTAFRSARLIVADTFKISQKKVGKRLLVSLPLFIISAAILYFSFQNKDGFSVIWRYFAWTNQLLSVFTLWAITLYLLQQRKNYYITLLPALYMSLMCTVYICISKEGFQLNETIAYTLSLILVITLLLLFIFHKNKIYNNKTIK
jgi:carbon starvation protein CstA